ncbi:MAG TPA: hypothetical protein VFO41_13065 [Alphaproteobacteria bacterium]|nr:hypothetical protein [Alphaproteobacteria bacterium]
MNHASVQDNSPSGLFTRQAWADELDAPAVAGHDPDDLEFARWVHGQAKTLAAHLDRLVRSEPSPLLSRQVSGLADTLWRDAEWARQRIDGCLLEAAE